jgi:hypothetical protein
MCSTREPAPDAHHGDLLALSPEGFHLGTKRADLLEGRGE